MPEALEPLRGAPEPAPNRIRWTRAQCDACPDPAPEDEFDRYVRSP